MNICFFGCSEPTSAKTSDGVVRAASLLAKELRRRGHQVDFYPPPKKPSSRRAESARFQQFLKGHKTDVAVWQRKGRFLPFSLKNLPCKLVTILHISPVLPMGVDAERVIRNFKLHSYLAQRLVRSKPCSFLCQKLVDIYRHSAILYALRHSDRFVLLSERFIPEFPLATKFPTKVCAIPNIAPYETQNISFSEKKKELLWLGRVEFTQKRPDLMLQIWKRLQCRFSDWSLRFVGDGSYLPELKDLAASLKLKNVFVEGFQDPVSYYRSASIFCMTSAFEGFGLVLVEAQAYGCVPIAFDSYSSVCDIIEDGVNGILVPPFDLDVYAEKLSELMLNPELRERLSRNAQKSVAKFSPEAIGDKWEKLLMEVVASNQGTSP